MVDYRRKKGQYQRRGVYSRRLSTKRDKAKRYIAIENALKSLPKSIASKIKRMAGGRKYTNRRKTLQRRRTKANAYLTKARLRNPGFGIKERGPRYPINKKVYSRLTLKKLLRRGMRRRYANLPVKPWKNVGRQKGESYRMWTKPGRGKYGGRFLKNKLGEYRIKAYDRGSNEERTAFRNFLKR